MQLYLLMVQLNSFYQVFIIVSAVILSTNGVFLGLLVTQQISSAIFTSLGFIALAGIDVNNNIVLVDTYNVISKENPELSREEIELSSKDENRPLNIKSSDIEISNNEKKIKKYIPLSKRQDKPDSALWLIKQHSILKDSQIAKLVGITKNSVTSIRNKSYWN